MIIVDVFLTAITITFLGLFFVDGPKTFFRRLFKNEVGGREELWDTGKVVFGLFFIMGLIIAFLSNIIGSF